MSLVLMQTDGVYELVRRRGRFDVERECAEDPSHFRAAVRDAQERMIEGLRKRGFEWVGPDWEISDPMPHLDFAQSTDADPGPSGMPDPRDTEKMLRWEEAEKARVARKVNPKAVDLVDFFLVSTFKVRKPQYLKVVGGSQVWTR
ncbi:MAG: hypothetical protein KGL39_05400 [Patescibacteria group bacterium]|nr:hypothetical protein [Patescibacteria group bacterium]